MTVTHLETHLAAAFFSAIVTHLLIWPFFSLKLSYALHMQLFCFSWSGVWCKTMCYISECLSVREWISYFFSSHVLSIRTNCSWMMCCVSWIHTCSILIPMWLVLPISEEEDNTQEEAANWDSTANIGHNWQSKSLFFIRLILDVHDMFH